MKSAVMLQVSRPVRNISKITKQPSLASTKVRYKYCFFEF